MPDPFRKVRGIPDTVLASQLNIHRAQMTALFGFVAGQVWQNRAMWAVLGTVVVWLAGLTLYILRVR